MLDGFIEEIRLEIIYYLLFATDIGLFKIPIKGSNLLLNSIMIVYCIFNYLKQRGKIGLSFFKIMEATWLIFILYFTVLLINDHTTTFTIDKLGIVFPYLMFFYTIAFFKTQERLERFKRVGIVFAITGSFLAIFQSMYGIEPMFDTALFYNVGHWGGQLDMIGSFARVMLPTLYWIEIVFVALLFYQMMNKKNTMSILTIFLLIPIFIGYARSHWIAIICAIMITTLFLTQFKVVKSSMFIRNIFIVFTVIFITVFFASFLANEDIGSTFLNRVSELFNDVKEGGGTYGGRLESITLAKVQWLSNVWFGLGPQYMDVTEYFYLSDVGYIFVLVTIGLVGLILFTLLMVNNFIFGVKTVKSGVKNNNEKLIFAGILPIILTVIFLINQQYTQFSYTVCLLAFIPGYAAAVHANNKDIKTIH